MGFNYLKAQSVTASAGDQNKSTKIDLNWTLGEIIVESTSKDELVLTQGFQQPKIEVISLQEEDVPVNACMVYPNPTNGEFNVQVPSSFNEDLNYVVTDLSGRIILEGKADLKTENNTAKINLNAYAAGVYMLKLKCGDKIEYTKLYKN